VVTLVQAQQRYIDRLLQCHPGHVRRVRRTAGRTLWRWAVARGYTPAVVLRDAHDLFVLITRADD
jgi:hypothetical protein